VADQEDGAGLVAELLDLLLGADPELGVTGRQGLVDEQDVVGLGGGDRELQPGRHAGRVRRHRQVDEVADAGELDDVVVALLDLGRGHAHRQTAQYYVPVAGEVVHHGRVDAQQGRLTAGVDRAGGRRQQAGDRPQQGRLAGAVAADQADRLAFVGGEADVLDRVHLADGRAVLALQDPAERARGRALAAAAGGYLVDDVDVVGDHSGDSIGRRGRSRRSRSCRLSHGHTCPPHARSR
jgi:hypothetical protein